MRSPERAAVLLSDGWKAAACAPDAAEDPGALDGLGLTWLPARVPGTAAGALLDGGRWGPGEAAPSLDAEDWWFRTRFEAEPFAADEDVVLRLDGVATVWEAFVNGVRVADGESMFAAAEASIGPLLREGSNELAICCRALAPLLRLRRRPRARWRTQLVADGNLRWFRTMLLGRAPGFAPGPAAVGPWRPVRIERIRGVRLDALRLRTRLEGEDGVLAVAGEVRGTGVEAVVIELDGPSGTHQVELTTGGRDAGGGALASARAAGGPAVTAADKRGGTGAETGATAVDAPSASLAGELRVPSVARWWPHTHGEPALHRVRLRVRTSDGSETDFHGGRVGFRTLAPGPAPGHDVERDGLDLHLNGVRVFARGPLWTPQDPVGLAPSDDELRAALTQVRDAGMNMVRIPGTAAYEAPAFHDVCDELGLLVWQDFMFANLDYPVADAGFRATIEREADELLDAIGGRPSTAVLCGNSEIEQQVAMLGLDPALGRGELFGELLPTAVSRAATDAVYVPSAPFGGTLPFRPDRGVANWFGVGGYRRPLEDARRAGVRFASECLAFANVPDEAGIEAIGTGVVHDPRWKAGVPRDVGPGWDFDDVRDHYLALLFGLDPVGLRSVDPERYLELSRAVTGEAMAEVFGEWRRAGSPCGGGLILWLRDLVAGAGWGIVDRSGTPKPVYHHLRRALAPVAVWTSDEGLGGIVAHVANDRADPLSATLRVALYRDGEQRVEEASEALTVPPHRTAERDVEGLLGHFADVAWAYRFGPPAQDAVVVSLEGPDGELLSQAFRFPAGRPVEPEPADRLGLEATAATPDADGAVELTIRSRRLAYGVRLHVPGYAASDDAFAVEPGGERRIRLTPRVGDETPAPGGALTALNLRGRVSVRIE